MFIMKKFLFLAALFLAGSFTCTYAIEEVEVKENPQENVTFIYINGSNTNDEKSKDWFFDGTNKFHPYLKKTLEADPLTKEKMLKGQEINPEAAHVYWGELSKAEIEFLMEEINFLSLKSPKLAGFARKLIATCLHDAIWVAKIPNMMPVINMTHKKVMEEHKKGNKVVLLGYSAGSFVSYQYLLNKMPMVDLNELASIENSAREEAYIKAITEAAPKNTCVEAIFKANLVSYSLDNNVTVNPSIHAFRKNLESLDEYTDTYCTPPNTIVGVINYASPLVLFYSELSDPRYKLGEINSFMYKYFVENSLFWLTVNYSDDPLGFPTTQNVTFEQVEKIAGFPIKSNGGLFYDKSDRSSRRTFAAAHTSYWSTGKRFARIVAEAYKEGYEYFYKKTEILREDL